MPIYEYRCAACGAVSEFLITAQDAGNALSCTSCGSSDLEKMLSAHNVKSVQKNNAGQICDTSCQGPSPACPPGCCPCLFLMPPAL